MQHRPALAVLWMAGAMVGFIAMAIAGREVAPMHDTFEIMVWRSAIGMGLVLGAAAVTGQVHTIRPRRLGQHTLRNLFHFAGQNLWFAALTMIPLAQLFAVEFTSPIFVTLAAPFLLGEALSQRKLVAAGLGFAGVLIVAEPFGAGGISLGMLFALIAAGCFALSIVMTKMMTRVAPMLEILFWVTAFQLVFGLVLALADGHTRLPTASSLPYLVTIGVAGLGAHFCLTRALSLAPASVVAPIDFARLPLIAIVGALVYDEALRWPIFVGGAVILLANWINLKNDSAAKMQRPVRSDRGSQPEVH